MEEKEEILTTGHRKQGVEFLTVKLRGTEEEVSMAWWREVTESIM